MRKLASIQRIDTIQPIEGADLIEVATLLGWKVVVRKGEFKPGDLCVYCEIDSVLPERPEFEFLAKSKYRVKSLRLRGQISQGICFPLSILKGFSRFPEYISVLWDEKTIGSDITTAIGVTKYDPPEISEKGNGFKTGFTKGTFPSYVSKTDEDRLQSVPKILEEIKNVPCYISVKIDGTSSTFAITEGEIDICSRNTSKKDEGSCVYWDIARKYKIVDILKTYDNIAIQGEVAGPGIQKNKLGLKERELFVFNVYDVKKGEHYSYNEFMFFCKLNNLQTVPIIDTDFYVGDRTVDDMLQLAGGTYPNGSQREGIVIRPLVERRSNYLHGGRLSFKIVNNNFLLKDR